MPLIEILLAEFRNTLNNIHYFVRRDYAFPKAMHIIKVALGMRRTGKTWFLYQTIQDLLAQNVPLDSILYLNFEDDRLLPMDQQGMAALLESFYSLFPENHQRQCYLFLDELQNVQDWQLVIRRFLDTKKAEIFLTGSSAKLLSKEIATSLRGRSLAIEIWPYHFGEYLRANQIEIPSKPIGRMVLDIYGKHLNEYMKKGGFPAVQVLTENWHREALQNYVETVIFRDVIERYGVTNISLLKYLAHSLLKNFACTFSVNKFFNDIKSQGFEAAKDTIYNYLTYLEDAFLIATVPVYTESLRRRQITAKKIYAVDTGLIQANVFSQHENAGRLLENLIYHDLRRANKKIFYYVTSSGYEIDFLTQSPEGKKELIQVVWNMSDPKTREREKRALHEAEEELNIPGKIIDQESYLRGFFQGNQQSD